MTRVLMLVWQEDGGALPPGLSGLPGLPGGRLHGLPGLPKGPKK